MSAERVGGCEGGPLREREGGLQQRLCNVALQEMKLHPEQGEEGATQRWVRRGGAGGR